MRALFYLEKFSILFLSFNMYTLFPHIINMVVTNLTFVVPSINCKLFQIKISLISPILQAEFLFKKFDCLIGMNYFCNNKF